VRGRRSPLRGTGVVGTFRHLADRASTFQKLGAAIIVAVSLLGLMGAAITRYAPWAWASEVNKRQTAIESKVDTLSSVVLQSQVADAENKIATLEAKAAGKQGLTDVEAEYLRGQRRRLNDLNLQLQLLSKPRM